MKDSQVVVKMATVDQNHALSMNFPLVHQIVVIISMKQLLRELFYNGTLNKQGVHAHMQLIF